jgi:hypothetical protein
MPRVCASYIGSAGQVEELENTLTSAQRREQSGFTIIGKANGWRFFRTEIASATLVYSFKLVRS